MPVQNQKDALNPDEGPRFRAFFDIKTVKKSRISARIERLLAKQLKKKAKNLRRNYNK